VHFKYCGGYCISSDPFVQLLKEFWSSVKVWWSYEYSKAKALLFHEPPSIVMFWIVMKNLLIMLILTFWHLGGLVV